MPLNTQHEDDAKVVTEIVEETLEDQEEQNSQIAPYGAPAEPEAERELNFA